MNLNLKMILRHIFKLKYFYELQLFSKLLELVLSSQFVQTFDYASQVLFQLLLCN